LGFEGFESASGWKKKVSMLWRLAEETRGGLGTAATILKLK